MAKMTQAHKQKVKEASSGLKKLTEQQMDAIKDLWITKDERFEDVVKLVHKSVLFKLTGDDRFASKQNRNQRAEQLNEILFS